MQKRRFPTFITYGTGRMHALKIMEHTPECESGQSVRPGFQAERKSGKAYILNKEETLAAQEKQAILQEKFRNWILRNPYRKKYLERLYYDTCACYMAGRFDGNFLSLPDLNPEVSLYPHQKSAVARIVLEKDVLLNPRCGKWEDIFHDCGYP